MMYAFPRINLTDCPQLSFSGPLAEIFVFECYFDFR